MTHATSYSGRIFSGVQPTGNVHLGNYLGAIKNWVALQSQYESLFCIVDLHAITVPQDPEMLRNNTRAIAAIYLACGIDPSKSVIFHQSAVSGHAELAWLLGCLTPLGWLNRMTQFKEKAAKNRENASLGLYAYPVLMAADILLYKASHVPVGEDQKQHLELARDIAGAFNRQFATDYFTLPEPVIMDSGARIMSLRDGRKKMSKSDESDYSRINLTDDSDTIRLKFRKAKSDAIEGIRYDAEHRPETSNLIDIYANLAGISRAEVEKTYANAQFSEFKQQIGELAVETLAPIREEIARLLDDKNTIDSILKKGAEKASAIAEATMKEVKYIFGLLE